MQLTEDHVLNVETDEYDADARWMSSRITYSLAMQKLRPEQVAKSPLFAWHDGAVKPADSSPTGSPGTVRCDIALDGVVDFSLGLFRRRAYRLRC